MQITRQDFEQMDRIYRFNLINSLSGIKPVTLTGTILAAGLSGLNTCYRVTEHAHYPYARVGRFPVNETEKP